MLDMDLLKAFVSVVDAGGFTAAGERVHRTQSTVSQQIRRLEEQVGRVLLLREGRGVRVTEDGERLLGYARRMLALSAEAEAVLARPTERVVRLGLPDDFAVASLTGLIASFAGARPDVRLAVTCGLSTDLKGGIERGELDVALLKREPGTAPALATWPERLVWVAGRNVVLPPDPVPLVAFRQGCLYRNRAVHALEKAGRCWRIAYESANLIAVEAALVGGLGVALLEVRAAGPSLRILEDQRLWPKVPPTELALCQRNDACAGARELSRHIQAFCEAEVLRQAA